MVVKSLVSHIIQVNIININLKYYDKQYPTIDHKISIYYGYINNMAPENLSDVKNLCITTRSNNASKGTKNNI
jgi:hypothetical protein